MTTKTLEPQLDPRALVAYLGARHMIDGELVPSQNGQCFGVLDPARHVEFAQAAAGDSADVDRAVQSAKAAQPTWAAMKARDRGRLVSECGRILEGHVEELGRLTALETGKALRTESRVEAGVVADVFHYFGGLAGELKGETIPFSPNCLTMTLREPVGVVGAIIPWNVPMLLMALKIAPALVAGNTVVVKSAEEAPFGVLRIAELLQQVLPKGVFNLLSGDGPTCGGPLAAHPDVAKLSFTGSVETGRIVYRVAAEKLVPVTLELGGKSPMLIMGDADLDKAVDGAVTGMRFTRQGQSCTAASRILVQRELVKPFVDKLRARVDKMVMGDPLDEATDIGTIVSPQQMARVQHFLKVGKSLPGAEAVECSALPANPELRDGLFVRPTIFLGLGNDTELAREEIFGPVTMVIPFDNYEEALAMANDTNYGLAATVWTQNLNLAMDAVHRLQAGFVQVNQNLVVQSMLSYGGIKQSGLGKEASLESMLEHYTRKKTVIVNMSPVS